MTLSAQANNRLVILSDEAGFENPLNEKKNNASALTHILSYFIQENEALILVSKSVLHQYLLDQAENSSVDNQISKTIFIFKVQNISSKDGNLYDTSYYLIAPTKYLVSRFKNAAKKTQDGYHKKISFRDEFDLQQNSVLKKIKPPKTVVNEWLAVAEIIAADKSRKGFASQFWINLFLTKEHVNADTKLLKPWSIMFFCHGNPTSTSGISIQDLQTFFIFLSEKLTTNVVTMACCYLAGSIKDKLCTNSFTHQPVIYDFHLIIAGLSDVPQIINFDNEGFAEEFFAQHNTKQNDINAAMTVNLFTHLIFADEFQLRPNLPSFGQIRYAGATHFTIPSKEVFHITPKKNVAIEKTSRNFSTKDPSAIRASNNLISHKKNCHTLLQAPSKKITLLYEESFRRPIEFKAIIDDVIDTTTSPIACANNYIERFLEWENEVDTKNFPAIMAAQQVICRDPVAIEYEEFVLQALEKLDPLGLHYPHIFSMLPKTLISRHPGVHFFDEIKLSNQVNEKTNPFIGILRFIHDAFFFNRQRYSENKFYIKTLRGYNDLSLLFECESKILSEQRPKIHRLANMRLPAILEKNRPQNLRQTIHHLAGKEIELTNVIVQSCFRDEDKKSICHVIFSLNTKQDEPDEIPEYSTWECLFEIPEKAPTSHYLCWCFLPTDTKSHTRSFEFEINDLGFK
jgi:hypothetical protein